MNNIVIITDSTSDLNKETREKYGIDYCRMGFSVDDKEYSASLDWEEISDKQFYDAMRNGAGCKTIQVTVKEYMARFGEYLKEGKDVIYIGCSSSLSGSVKLAQMLAPDLMREYKGTKLVCIDSLLSGLGQGMMVIKAAQLAEEGKSIEEIASYIENMKMSCNQAGTVSSLEYLKKSGRVTASSAFFGNLFAVKPILISDDQGQNLAVKKVKGRKSSLIEIADQISRYIKNPEDQIIYISHADARDDAEEVAKLVRDRIPGAKTELNIIGPIVGTSVGPGTIIAYFRGVEKTEHMKQL